MPRTSSAKKALRVSRTNALRNRRQRVAMKKAVRAATPATTSATVSQIAKAAKRGIISKARLARLTSRLMRAAKLVQLAKRPSAGVSAKATKPAKKPVRKKALKKSRT